MRGMGRAREHAEESGAMQAHKVAFQHTQLGVYLAGTFGLLYLFSDSAQVRGQAEGHQPHFDSSACPHPLSSLRPTFLHRG